MTRQCPRDSRAVTGDLRARVPARTSRLPEASESPVQTADSVVQVLRLEQRVRTERRAAVMVALPCAILGHRVAGGLRAVPLRYGLLAFVGLLLLRDLGLHGAVLATLCGVLVGLGIGVALVRGADPSRRAGGHGRPEGRRAEGEDR